MWCVTTAQLQVFLAGVRRKAGRAKRECLCGLAAAAGTSAAAAADAHSHTPTNTPYPLHTSLTPLCHPSQMSGNDICLKKVENRCPPPSTYRPQLKKTSSTRLPPRTLTPLVFAAAAVVSSAINLCSPKTHKHSLSARICINSFLFPASTQQQLSNSQHTRAHPRLLLLGSHCRPALTALPLP